MKKLFCLAALLVLSACTGGYFVNPTQAMTDVHALRSGDGPAYAQDAAQCRATVHREADPIGTPENIDHERLFNECMKVRGWVPRTVKPSAGLPDTYNH